MITRLLMKIIVIPIAILTVLLFVPVTIIPAGDNPLENNLLAGFIFVEASLFLSTIFSRKSTKLEADLNYQ